MQVYKASPALGNPCFNKPSGGADAHCSLLLWPFIECKHMAGAHDHYGAIWMAE